MPRDRSDLAAGLRDDRDAAHRDIAASEPSIAAQMQAADRLFSRSEVEAEIIDDTPPAQPTAGFNPIAVMGGRPGPALFYMGQDGTLYMLDGDQFPVTAPRERALLRALLVYAKRRLDALPRTVFPAIGVQRGGIRFDT